LQGYLLVLWDTPVGLLGAAYLLLLVAILLLPPELLSTAASTPAQPVQRRRARSQPRQRAGSASAGADEWLLQQPLLPGEDADTEAAAQEGTRDLPASSAHAGADSRGCGSRAAGLRWVLPALLALLCAADLSAQYALVVGAVVQDWPLIPPEAAAWIRDVVGIDDTASGTDLLLALLRPTFLMAALAVYRWACNLLPVLCAQTLKQVANLSIALEGRCCTCSL
jgi:hypothetical protein